MDLTYTIARLDPGDFDLCGALWDIERRADLASRFRRELLEGNRTTFLCRDGEAPLGEVSLVRHMDDPDYTIENRRLYVSRLLVRKDVRRRGIGRALLRTAFETAREWEYAELSVGVDLDNFTALKLYWEEGFDSILYIGEDGEGQFVKLLKRL